MIRIANGRFGQPENTQLPVLLRRFEIYNSELYDAGLRKVLAAHPLAQIALDDIQLHLDRTPEAADRLDLWPGRAFYVMRTPATPMFPSLRLLYEVDPPLI